MAKGRKKETQVAIMEKDKRLFQALAKTARGTSDLIQEHYNISHKRIDKLVKQGYLKKEPIIWENKATYCYRLSRKSQDYVKSNLHTVSGLYKPTSVPSTHDIALFKEFSKLTNTQQDLAMTETDIVKIYGKLSYASPVDLYVPAYQDENGIAIQEQAIEIITPSYSKEDIEKKEIYVKECLKISSSSYRKVYSNYKSTREM
ncbi:hypothetical protein SDC9_48153 [bioreactor metagenome]|uniref:Uncharacterized protein n=1 Tax=bioreactor metagenome TaxID=1076179 RepID=A0A644WHB6_9ZZZZ